MPRELSRDDKLRIAAEANQKHLYADDGMTDDENVAEVEAAIRGCGASVPWHKTVRTLATAAMAEPVDLLTEDERHRVECYRGAEEAYQFIKIIDRLAPKVPA